MTEAPSVTRRKKRGLCITCREATARKAVPGQVRCKECAKKVRDNVKAHAKARKEKGLCIRCGYYPPASEGSSWCDECLSALRKWRRRQKRARKK